MAKFGDAIAINTKVQPVAVIASSFSEHGVILDGTPAFAEAEARIVTLVTLDWELMGLLIHVNLLQKAPNAV